MLFPEKQYDEKGQHNALSVRALSVHLLETALDRFEAT